MRISLNTQLQSLSWAGIVSVLWVVWLLRNHATFWGCRVVFTEAFALLWRSICERIHSRLAQCRILLMSSWLCDGLKWMAF